MALPSSFNVRPAFLSQSAFPAASNLVINISKAPVLFTEKEPAVNGLLRYLPVKYIFPEGSHVMAFGNSGELPPILFSHITFPEASNFAKKISVPPKELSVNEPIETEALKE